MYRQRDERDWEIFSLSYSRMNVKVPRILKQTQMYVYRGRVRDGKLISSKQFHVGVVWLENADIYGRREHDENEWRGLESLPRSRFYSVELLNNLKHKRFIYQKIHSNAQAYH